MKRIREAKRALEARAKEEAAAAGEPAESAKPDPKAQYNFTDPESRIMKGPDGFVQAYNVQVAVDDLQLIVGQAVTQETNDKKQLMPMITTIEQQSGDTPTQVLADAGYCSDESLTAIADTTHRCVHLDAEAETWRAAGAVSARTAAEDGHDRRSDVPEAAHEDRRGRLRGAQRDRRTGDRTDQTGARLSAILVAGIREGAG